MNTCEACGEGKDPMNETGTEWQCDCEHWNPEEPENIEIPDEAVAFLREWASDRDMTPLDMMTNIEFLRETMRVLEGHVETTDDCEG